MASHAPDRLLEPPRVVATIATATTVTAIASLQAGAGRAAARM
jgi:hypothetical protein